ncbi:hypothetical protein Q3G72_020633 [Acer saccharum]|nr:hypothetical protein Q3G72_020633 [Acer saccharum]
MLPPAVTVLPSPSTPRLCLDCFSLVDDAAWSNRSNSLMPRQVFDFQESYGGSVKDCWSRAGELIADFKTGGKVVAFHYVLNLMRWEWWIYVMRPVSLVRM